MSRHVIVIGGTRWQLPLIESVKRSGFVPVVLSPTAPSLELSDSSHIWERADIVNLEECFDIASRYTPVAVVSDQSDIAVPTVAFISESLSLPTLGTEKADLCTNKFEMRRFCLANGFFSPKFKLCFSLNDLRIFISSNGFPIVIKPLNSNSSRGVFLLDSPQDISLRFFSALSYSRGIKAVLAESFISGDELTVEGVFIAGKHVTLAVSKKEHFDFNSSIAKDLWYSSDLSTPIFSLASDINDTLMNAVNLPDGTLTHNEFKVDGSTVCLIEMAARGGGNFISSHIVPSLTGIDLTATHLKSRLPSSHATFVGDCKFSQRGRYALLTFFDSLSSGGRIVLIKGESFLRGCGNIIDYKLNYKVGDILPQPSNDAERLGYAIAIGDSWLELSVLREKIHERVQFITDD